MKIKHLALAVVLLAASPTWAQDESAPVDSTPETIEDRALALMNEGKEKEAFTLISQGAKDGDPLAVNYLAWFYENGRHVEQDRVRAAELYRIAAKAGVRYSKWRLGVMIDQGMTKGTLEQAVALFREAAEMGSSNAWSSLAVMQATGRGTEKNYDLAYSSYEKAARLGNPHGLQGLGVLYGNGEGVDANPIQAMAYWLVAKAMGNPTATEKYDRFIETFDSEEVGEIFSAATKLTRDYGFRVNLLPALGDYPEEEN